MAFRELMAAQPDLKTLCGVAAPRAGGSTSALLRCSNSASGARPEDLLGAGGERAL